MIQILVIEDDFKLNKLICKTLTDNKYHVDGKTNPKEAEDLIYEKDYNLIISDIMMPGLSGFELAELIRHNDKNIPILFITARDDFSAKQKGFSIGVDDYMVKPLDMKELLLRVEALLRRANISNAKKLTVENLTMDEEQMKATINGKDIPTTVREFNILYKMLSYPGRTFSRSQMMDEFWDYDSESGFRAIDVYITKLRNKFSECDGFKIVTIHGLGYKVELNEKSKTH